MKWPMWVCTQIQCPAIVSELNGLNSSTVVESTDVSSLHWQMYCGMWHVCIFLDWLTICQSHHSHVHRMAEQLFCWQQQVVTLTWWGNWWSSTEQTCCTSQRWVMHPSVCDSDSEPHLSCVLAVSVVHPLKYTSAHKRHSTVRLVGIFSCLFIFPYI